MTGTELLIDVGFRETRVAEVRDGLLVDLKIEPATRASVVGNIYLGRVVRVVPQLRAAFVDLGLGKDGFLAADSAKHLSADGGSDGRPEIGDLVHEGEAILVQVTADAVGTKGVRLEADISLPGRYAVFGPRRGGVAVSRRINDETERGRLIDIFKGALGDDGAGGFVVRTAAEGEDEAALVAEAEALAQRWAEIEEKASKGEAPAEIEAELDAVLKTLRDAAAGEIGRVVVSDRAALARAQSYATLAFSGGGPEIAGHKIDGDLFEDMGVEEQIEELLEPRVSLPGGGAITIETTEAMTTVDVDTGGVRGPDRNANALAVNLEAAAEAARQVRLRGIGGLIVVDFVRLDESGHRKQVIEALKSALAEDPSPTRIGSMDDFDLVAFTRKRSRQGLAASMLERCDACHATGWRLSVDAAAAEAYRLAEFEARSGGSGALTITVAPDVAEAMNSGEANVAAFANRVGREIAVAADARAARDDVEVVIE